MKVYRIQKVGAEHVGCATVHKDEASAKAETASILEAFVLSNLNAMVRHNARWGTRQEFVQAGVELLGQARALLSGKPKRVWEVYDLWQEFYDRFETEFGPPLFMVLGTVNVDTREAEPLQKRRLFPATGTPPFESVRGPSQLLEAAELEVYSIVLRIERLVLERAKATGEEMPSAEFRRKAGEVVKELEKAARGEDLPWETQAAMVEEALKKRFGLSGPAMRIWRVIYMDILCLAREGGCINSYTDEELAKEHTASLLRTVAGRLEDQARAARSLGRAHAYVADVGETAPLVRAALEEGNVWGAYEIWNAFETRHPMGPEPQLGYPLHTQIGTVRVEVR